MVNYRHFRNYVLDYMKDNDDVFDSDKIHEYVDGLLPLYYGQIYHDYHDLIGTPLGIEITQDMVGMEVWQVMNMRLFDEYLTLFMEKLHQITEEEE
tara:strand:+ start:50 stop:337 length:288 start_codon:yes stop_codon:yes gene_type:complete